MEVDDFEMAVASYDEPLGPPWWLLALAAAAILASGVLLLWRGETAHITGYVLAALVAVTTVAVYRYVDGRRQMLARYRSLYWAGRVGVALLVLGWIVACTHAWALATMWAR